MYGLRAQINSWIDANIKTWKNKIQFSDKILVFWE